MYGIFTLCATQSIVTSDYFFATKEYCKSVFQQENFSGH